MNSTKEIAGPLLDRAVIRLSPTQADEDVREFLQGLVTQDSSLVSPDTPLWSALLTPQGKVLFDFFLFGDAEAPMDIVIDCQAAQANALIKRLSLYRLRRKIEIALDEGFTVFWSNVRHEGKDRADPRLPQLGQRWIADTGETAGQKDVATAYHAHRLSLGVAEGMEELGSGDTLWLECNAIELNGVSFTKGCYVGQENTARMNWRSKVNRRMVIVPLHQADEKRQRIAYDDAGLSVEHRRVEDLGEMDLPEWLKETLTD